MEMATEIHLCYFCVDGKLSQNCRSEECDISKNKTCLLHTLETIESNTKYCLNILTDFDIHASS